MCDSKRWCVVDGEINVPTAQITNEAVDAKREEEARIICFCVNKPTITGCC